MGDEWQQNPGYGPRNPQNKPEVPPDEQEPKDAEIPQDEWVSVNPQQAPDGQEAQEAQGAPETQPFSQENIDKIKRLVIQGASEAQRRITRVAGRATEYWQQANNVPEPR